MIGNKEIKNKREIILKLYQKVKLDEPNKRLLNDYCRSFTGQTEKKPKQGGVICSWCKSRKQGVKPLHLHQLSSDQSQQKNLEKIYPLINAGSDGRIIFIFGRDFELFFPKKLKENSVNNPRQKYPKGKSADILTLKKISQRG